MRLSGTLTTWHDALGFGFISPSEGGAEVFEHIKAFPAGPGRPLVPMLYAVMSVLTFFAYAFDKSAAASGRRCTAENTLHLLALGGGWPGALLAQQVLRHKTGKPGFAAVFWATVLANGVGLRLWHAGPAAAAGAVGADTVLPWTS